MIFLNHYPVIFGRFPNGELNLPVEGLDIRLVNHIKFVYDDDSDFLKLALVKGLIDDMNGTAMLYMTYMPYSRMDRPNGHYAVSLKAVAKMINNMDFEYVTIREPHSPATVDLIDNCLVDNWCQAHVNHTINLGNYDSIFFPDAGAMKRYDMPNIMPIAIGSKTRDFLSGNINGLKIIGEVGKNVLIVDDLCSRGGTFIEGSKELKKMGAEKVSLLVAYVEDNVFTGDVFDHIEIIYTSSERELRNDPRFIKLF